MLTTTAEIRLTENPDRVIMLVPGESPDLMRYVAREAVVKARANAPKLTGDSARRLMPIWGPGFFGIYFPDSRIWFQDHGVRPFTMKSLAGKTIPMWIDDPTGVERQKNPKAKTRTTASGKIQVLIFRKVAEPGQRIQKTRTDRKTGTKRIVSDVPASYPGAPGRISRRESSAPGTTPGKIGGAIAKGNGGVRWRYPGLAPRLFLNNAMTLAAVRSGIMPIRVYIADGASSFDMRHQG